MLSFIDSIHAQASLAIVATSVSASSGPPNRSPNWQKCSGYLRLISGDLWLVSGALLLTHYWAMFLLAATGLGILWSAWRAPTPAQRRRSLEAAVAIAAMVVGDIGVVGCVAGGGGRSVGGGRGRRGREVSPLSLPDIGQPHH